MLQMVAYATPNNKEKITEIYIKNTGNVTKTLNIFMYFFLFVLNFEK